MLTSFALGGEAIELCLPSKTPATGLGVTSFPVTSGHACRL